MLVDSGSVHILLVLHFLLHLVEHVPLFLLDFVHLGDEVSFSLRVSDPLLGSLLLLRQLNDPGLELRLLVAHHLQIVFSLHHVSIGFHAEGTHSGHEHLGLLVRIDSALHVELRLASRWLLRVESLFLETDIIT